ncbi:MAG: HlyD family efflux transporter periplasmic adaptor subunit, partial [Pirellulales bacterium]
SVDAAQAAVNRLEASIKENDDISVESTGLRQTLAFVESMARTVESAEARVEAGQKRMEFAEAQLGRERQSFDAGGSTQEALDRAEVQFVEARVDYQQDRLVLAAMRAMQTATDLTPTMVRQYIDRKQLSRDVLEEQRDEAQVQLQRALLDAHRGVLTSPVDGVVLTRHVSNERYLAAGEVLLEIGQLDQLQVEVEVLSQDVVHIKPGDPAEVYGPAIGPRPAAATVTRIYPAGFTKVSSLGVEQQRVLVVLAFDEAELARLRQQRDLGVDYRVRVKIYTDSADDALRVPRSALFRGPSGGEDWQVFVVEAGRARLKPIKVGLMNDDEVQILEGLSEGQQVILAPETDLQDGAAVRTAS